MYEGKTPLFTCAHYGYFELFLMLIQRSEINLSTWNHLGSQIIHFACECENIDFLKYLLAYKFNEIDINSLDNSGSTPFHLAYSHLHIEAVELLFNHKDILKPNIQNMYELTPLMTIIIQRRNESLTLSYVEYFCENVKIEERAFFKTKVSSTKNVIDYLRLNHQNTILNYLNTLSEIASS